MRALTHLVLGSLLLSVMPGLARALTVAATDLCRSGHELPIVGGCIVGIGVGYLVVTHCSIVHVFEHELTHLLACLMCFRIPTSFRATSNGGHVESIGADNILMTDFCSLAPYIAPTFALMLLTLRSCFIGQPMIFDSAIGLTLGYHALTTVHETRLAWTTCAVSTPYGNEASDIAAVGFVYSSIYIVCGLLASHGILFAIIAHGLDGVFVWSASVGHAVSSFYDTIAPIVGIAHGSLPKETPR